MKKAILIWQRPSAKLKSSFVQASEYRLYLLSKSVLKKKSQGWVEQQGAME